MIYVVHWKLISHRGWKNRSHLYIPSKKREDTIVFLFHSEPMAFIRTERSMLKEEWTMSAERSHLEVGYLHNISYTESQIHCYIVVKLSVNVGWEVDMDSKSADYIKNQNREWAMELALSVNVSREVNTQSWLQVIFLATNIEKVENQISTFFLFFSWILVFFIYNKDNEVWVIISDVLLGVL